MARPSTISIAFVCNEDPPNDTIVLQVPASLRDVYECIDTAMAADGGDRVDTVINVHIKTTEITPYGAQAFVRFSEMVAAKADVDELIGFARTNRKLAPEVSALLDFFGLKPSAYFDALPYAPQVIAAVDPTHFMRFEIKRLEPAGRSYHAPWNRPLKRRAQQATPQVFRVSKHTHMARCFNIGSFPQFEFINNRSTQDCASFMLSTMLHEVDGAWRDSGDWRHPFMKIVFDAALSRIEALVKGAGEAGVKEAKAMSRFIMRHDLIANTEAIRRFTQVMRTGGHSFTDMALTVSLEERRAQCREHVYQPVPCRVESIHTEDGIVVVSMIELEHENGLWPRRE